MRETFRGAVVKEWVAMPNETIDYSKHDNALIEKGVRLHSECWNQRCTALHNPDAKKNA